MSAPAPTLSGDGPLAIYGAMVGLGVLCGALVVTAFVTTHERIEQNRIAVRERAIRSVLPGTARIEAFGERASGGFVRVSAQDGAVRPVSTDASARVHAGYTDDGRLLGLAIEARGLGYQDVIALLYGYSFERHAIVGLEVLESRETPGLGDRIVSDPSFRASFESLDVRLSTDGTRVANRIEAVKPGARREPWQVDGITGATVSAVAVADIVRESTQYWIPRVRAHVEDFRRVE